MPGVLGIGDDCCIWTPGGPTCLSTDSIVEGVHFTRQASAALVGRKAAAAALSDLAAMGARAVGATLALHLGRGWDVAAVADGFIAELHRHGCPLLGGDTVASGELALGVTVWGEAPPGGRLVRRTGAACGDLLVVTGRLGGSLPSGRHLTPEPRLIEGQWLAAQPAVRAMMDVSDGVAADARRLAEVNACGALILPMQIPLHPDLDGKAEPERHACCDGEDYELLLAVAAPAWPDLAAAWPFAIPLSVVGWMVPEPGLWQEDEQGRVVSCPWRGYEHSGT